MGQVVDGVSSEKETIALDHWFFDAYNFWLKGSGNSAGSKMRNRRHLALDLAPSFDLDLLRKAGS